MKDPRVISSIILAIGLVGAAALIAFTSADRADRYQILEEKQNHGYVKRLLFDRKTGALYERKSRELGDASWKVTVGPVGD